MVLIAKIIRWEVLWPSMMITDVTHLSLNDTLLTETVLPSWIAFAMCLYDASMAVWGGVSIWIIELCLKIQDYVGIILCIL